MSAQGTRNRNRVTTALLAHPLSVVQRAAWAAAGFDREPDAWGPFVEAWLDHGFRLPPQGEPTDDPDTSLRSRLWPIAEARPEALGRWIREAPGRNAYAVAGHAFRCWRAILNDLPDDDWEQFDAAKRAARAADARPAMADWTRLRDMVVPR